MRLHIRELIADYKKLSKTAGVRVSKFDSHIQPLIIGGANETIKVSFDLLKKDLIL